MNKKLQLVGLLLGAVLIFGASFGASVTVDQGNSNNFSHETDELVVQVVGGGQVPMYTFWDPAEDTIKYRVQFSSVFEALDSSDEGTEGVYDYGADNRVPMSSIALPSLMWEFTEVTEDSEGLHFDIVASDGSIELRNHLYTQDENSIKFDVVINDYDFVSEESNAILVFSFMLQIIDGEDTEEADASQNGNSISFGDGFFESEETATAGGSTINVGLSTASEEGNSKAYLAYENFDGDLVHDPTMGVQAASSNPDDTDGDGGPALASDEILILWDFDISIEDAGFTTIFATMIALIVPITLYRRKD